MQFDILEEIKQFSGKDLVQMLIIGVVVLAFAYSLDSHFSNKEALAYNKYISEQIEKSEEKTQDKLALAMNELKIIRSQLFNLF